MKEIFYDMPEEVLGKPLIYVDDNKLHDMERAAAIISQHTGISKDTLLQLINNYGIETVLNNAEEMDITKEQVKSLNLLKDILHMLGALNHESV